MDWHEDPRGPADPFATAGWVAAFIGAALVLFGMFAGGGQ